MAAPLVTPHSLEAERAVLGAALVNEKALLACVESLADHDFYDPAHQIIFSAIYELESSGSPVDFVSLNDKLSKKGELSKIGSGLIVDLIESYTSVANVDHHIKLVREYSLLRALIKASRDVIDLAMRHEEDLDVLLNRAGSMIFDVVEKRETSEYYLLKYYLQKALSQYKELEASGDALRGIPTGYPEIDELTNGLGKGTLIVLAGRPGTGKTAFALNLARGYLRKADPEDPKNGVMFFSLEMTGEELALRMVSAESLIPLEKLIKARLSAEDYDRFLSAMNALESFKIIVDETGGISLNVLKARARSAMRKYHYKLLIIDHMQIITMPGGAFNSANRTNMLAQISGQLKALSKELSIPIIVLSQLNRGVEHRQDRTPGLADLRDSGAIEQDADIVAIISRDDYYDRDNAAFPGVVDVDFAKHRNGRMETVHLRFHGETMRFESLDEATLEAYIEYKKNKKNAPKPGLRRLPGGDTGADYSNPGF